MCAFVVFDLVFQY